MDTRVVFKARATATDSGVRIASLVEPAARHIDGPPMMTERAVRVAWEALFGHNGRVREDSALVERFDGDYMVNVVVNLGDVRTAVRFRRSEYWQIVDDRRAGGTMLLDAEAAAHDALVAAVVASQSGADDGGR